MALQLSLGHNLLSSVWGAESSVCQQRLQVLWEGALWENRRTFRNLLTSTKTTAASSFQLIYVSTKPVRTSLFYSNYFLIFSSSFLQSPKTANDYFCLRFSVGALVKVSDLLFLTVIHEAQSSSTDEGLSWSRWSSCSCRLLPVDNGGKTRRRSDGLRSSSDGCNIIRVDWVLAGPPGEHEELERSIKTSQLIFHSQTCLGSSGLP